MFDLIHEHREGIHDFTDEDLDFIINYDIKHRMGADGGDEEESP